MRAKELDVMVKAMKGKYNKIDTRADITNMLFYLHKGLCAIDRKELAQELANLYAEIDNIETDEIVKLGTFR